MASIETEVNKIIGGIAGSVISNNSTTLNSLGFDATKCMALAKGLDSFVKEKKPGASVSPYEITTALSVTDIINVVAGKIG